ncbi:hypothetical protein [Phycicoccus duodecadis]|uniref:Excisionase family DNA binding protein n=1 Tax=Phycicoccus duodecadis TaxID=173053 RepID=A0A2N3YEZ4_9MICO|nr:hypothetical protein [Phycicoccus duodecadis]PKW25413.1 hypothetical protein ATL31_0201 [Phycicoccus duodecadis]
MSTAPNIEALRGRLTITVDELYPALGIGRNQAYAAVANGTIPSLRLGHRIVIPVPKLLALLGDDAPPGPASEPSITRRNHVAGPAEDRPLLDDAGANPPAA